MQRGITLSGFRKNKGVVWILPAFLFLVVIIYYSMFFTFDLSTASWDGLSPVREAVGLKNQAVIFLNSCIYAIYHHTIFSINIDILILVKKFSILIIMKRTKHRIISHIMSINHCTRICKIL